MSDAKTPMEMDESATQLERLIQDDQAQVSAQIETVLALTGAGFDTAEAATAMWREIDALADLRRHQRMLYATTDL